MADDIKRFSNPTIGDVIDELSKHPRDAQIAIKDADTDWYLGTFALKFDAEENVFLLRARYYDQDKKDGG